MPDIVLNPDPSGDDAPQINAALSTCRTAGYGSVLLAKNSAQDFNIKSSVNMTAMGYTDLRLGPGTLVYSNGFTQNAPMFDMSSSWFSGITGQNNCGGILLGFGSNSPAGTVVPNCAILIANNDSKRLKDVSVSGQFQAAALGIVGCTDIDIEGGGFSNYNPGAPVLVMSSHPDWGLCSIFQNPVGNTGFVADVYLRTRFHGLGRQTWTGFMRDSSNIHFDHCLWDNNNRAQLLCQGASNYVVMTGGKSYSELGVTTLAGVVECGGSDAIKNLKMVGFESNTGAPLTIGSGNYSGLQII